MWAAEFKVMCVVGVVALAAAVFLAGCGRTVGPSPVNNVTPLPSPRVPVSAGYVYPDELPVSVLPDAERAAVRAVAMTGEVVRAGLTSRGDVIRTFATPEYAAELLETTNTQLRTLTADLVKRGISLDQLQVVETPITVDATVGEGFVVAWVWSVTVVVAPGMGTARQIWRTIQIELVPEGDRWLVNDWSVDPGPTPVPDPEASFDDARRFEIRMQADHAPRLGAS